MDEQNYLVFSNICRPIGGVARMSGAISGVDIARRPRISLRLSELHTARPRLQSRNGLGLHHGDFQRAIVHGVGRSVEAVAQRGPLGPLGFRSEAQ
jgi:hypothetical protein